MSDLTSWCGCAQPCENLEKQEKCCDCHGVDPNKTCDYCKHIKRGMKISGGLSCTDDLCGMKCDCLDIDGKCCIHSGEDGNDDQSEYCKRCLSRV